MKGMRLKGSGYRDWAEILKAFRHRMRLMLDEVAPETRLDWPSQGSECEPIRQWMDWLTARYSGEEDADMLVREQMDKYIGWLVHCVIRHGESTLGASTMSDRLHGKWLSMAGNLEINWPTYRDSYRMSTPEQLRMLAAKHARQGRHWEVRASS